MVVIMIMVYEWQTDDMIELWLCLYVDGGRGGGVWAGPYER